MTEREETWTWLAAPPGSKCSTEIWPPLLARAMGRYRRVGALLLSTRCASGMRPAGSYLKSKTTAGSRLEAVLQAPFGADDPRAAETLGRWFDGKRRVVVLSGAGLSTDSGIPDYRGEKGSYRMGHRPISHDEFLGQDASRRRYWARALVGYDRFGRAVPNRGHEAIAELSDRGRVSGVITQNVDGLQEKAGTRGLVVPLHGRGYRVRCLECGHESCRSAYHDELEALNPAFAAQAKARRSRDDASDALRPDGDADLDDFERFTTVAPCGECGTGVVKPDVVFFGDIVPKDRVDECFRMLDDADGLLCVGTSLAVFSAFRFVRKAAQAQLPICVLNRGSTRCDAEDIAGVTKVTAGCDALHAALPLIP